MNAYSCGNAMNNAELIILYELKMSMKKGNMYIYEFKN